jgi:hypothetical protein
MITHAGGWPTRMRMFRMFTSVSVAAVLPLLMHGPTAASAQTPIKDYYDTTKPITIKGTLRAIWGSPGRVPMMIMLEVPGDGGKVTQWFVAGRPAFDMQREGLDLIGPMGPIKGGDVISVSGYVPKPGSKAGETLATALQEAAGPNLKAGFVDELRREDVHLMHGIEIILADGKKLAYGETP